MLAQKIVIDGDPFIMTLPKMREHSYFLRLLRARYREQFNTRRFHSLVFHDQANDLLLNCSDQNHMQYNGAAHMMSTSEEFQVVDQFEGVGLTVFPKLIPLDQLDRPYKLNEKDYPEGTITTGGTISIYPEYLKPGIPYSTASFDSVGSPVSWGDHFIGDDTQVCNGQMSWVVIDGLLFAVTAAWRCTIPEFLSAFLWDYEGETLNNRYHRCTFCCRRAK